MVKKLERIEYVEDPHLGKGSYCVVEMHADGGACSVPDYAVIKLVRHIVKGEGPDTIVRGIDEAIQALPEGYDTVCTDGIFSQGEWQLLSIARAAAADPAVLLLDEITANLDAETEARVREALRQASRGRTVLSVSHRIYESLGGRTVEIRPRECSPGGHGASGAVKNRGKKRLTVPMGSAMMGCGQKRPISAINGGECSWIAAEVQDEAGYAARRDTGCGHPWTGADHILLCRVLLHRTGDVLLWQLSLRRCIFAPILPKVASKEDKNMMNRMVNKEFAQEIAAVIRTAQNGDRLPELLKHYHQRDVAKAVTLLTDAERERLFRQLDARTLAEIFPYLDDASRFLAELPADLAAAVITDMDTADALDMLRELPAEKKQTLAAHLDDDTRKDVRRLLAFHQEEIGSRMSGNFVCIPDTLTVCGAMNELVRQAGEHDNISTLYVVDGSGVFAGAIDLKDLIIARENDPLSGIIRRSYPYVLAHEKVEDCIDRIAEYEEDSLPVLTEDGRIAGILTAQDLVELVDDAMGDDYAKLGGLTSEEDLREPAAVSMKKRLPWLIVLLFLGMGVSSVVGIFESVVAVLPIVICFQSLVLDMAGNVGTQSLAVTIRVLMDENLTLKEELALLGKEMRVGLLNGGCLGLMALAVLGVYIHVCKGYAWGPAFLISGCVGVSLVVAMVISSLVGTMVPMLFHKIHIDPAVASGPLITTVNDLVAVVTYYGLALLFLVNVFHL